MKTLIFSLILVLSGIFKAQKLEFQFQPTPQQIVSTGKSAAVPKEFNFRGSIISPAAKRFLNENFSLNKKGTKIFVKVSNKDLKPEGYRLETGKKIQLTAADERGLYYGLQTLNGLLKESSKTGNFPAVIITDYPDVSRRGVVEGFYGTPWSYEDRLSQLKFYGKHRLNTYIYGPKDDPYHSSPNWRKPYPTDEAEKIKNLAFQAEQNAVDFVWAIHPGQDIKWNNDDRQALLNKFENMYQLGIRAFAVFFDDISGEGTNAEKQAELLNFLDDEFVAKKKDVKPLIMCPTEYNKAWANPKGGYLKTLGTKLNSDIEIMWTGDTVIGDVSESSVKWINGQINRKAFFWWNFPVTDYVRNHLMMGRAYGLDPKVNGELSGLVSNPMEHAEASKPAIYSLAQFAWNMDEFNSDKAWKEGLQLVMPQNYDALQVFAKHNSDPGQNGHRYRREESVEFAPIAEQFLADLKSGKSSNQTEKVKAEYSKIIAAAQQLLNSKENPPLMEEIQPWVMQFKNLGETGLASMDLYENYNSGNQQGFLKAYENVKAAEKNMYEFSQNTSKTGIATGGLILKPLIEETFTTLTTAYNKKYGANLPAYSRYTQHKIFTNIEKLKFQPLISKDRSIEISPVLETISVPENGFFGIELDKVQNFRTVIADVQGMEPQIEISEDGKNWTSLDVKPIANTTQWEAKSGGKTTKFIRIKNTTNNTQTIKLNVFRIQF